MLTKIFLYFSFLCQLERQKRNISDLGIKIFIITSLYWKNAFSQKNIHVHKLPTDTCTNSVFQNREASYLIQTQDLPHMVNEVKPYYCQQEQSNSASTLMIFKKVNNPIPIALESKIANF